MNIIYTDGEQSLDSGMAGRQPLYSMPGWRCCIDYNMNDKQARPSSFMAFIS